jgi:hypothetical protein
MTISFSLSLSHAHKNTVTCKKSQKEVNDFTILCSVCPQPWRLKLHDGLIITPSSGLKGSKKERPPTVLPFGD